MKTLEFKLDLNQQQQATIDHWLEELTWVWNEGLKLLFEFHQHKYYAFMLEAAQKRGIDMDGIDMVRLSFPKHSAWSLPMMPNRDRFAKWLKWEPKQKQKFVGLGGATCRIARIVDGNYETIPAHERYQVEPARLKNNSAMSLGGVLTKTYCNKLRAEQELPALTVHSDYLGGVLNQLATAWKAYCDPKIRHAHKPKFRGGKNPGVASLFGMQPEGIEVSLNDGTDSLKMPALGMMPIVGLRAKKRLKLGSIPRSAILKCEPSGFYACVTFAEPLELEKQKVNRDRTAARSAAKKAGAKLLPEIEAEYKLQLQRLETALMAQQRHEAGIKPSSKIVGIDPGVVALVATDGGRFYTPNKRMQRTERKRLRLQRKAARQYEANKDNSNWQRKNYDKTQHEIALQWEKIRRSRSAYTHKLSTKFVREFGVIAIEDTQLQNMTKAAQPKVNATGTGYDRNNRKAKAGLNRSLLNACIGQFRSRLESKAKVAGRLFLESPAQNSSQRCHCCREMGERLTQNEFYCRNPQCTEFDKRQHADVNAARNHLIGAIAVFTQTEAYPGLAGEGILIGESKPGDPVISPEAGTTTSNGSATASTKGMPQEAADASGSKPLPEYGKQSHPDRELFKAQLRESEDVILQEASKTPETLSQQGLKRRRKKCTRDPSTTQLSINFDEVGDQLTG